MLTVEDIIETLARNTYHSSFGVAVPDPWHRRFIENVSAHTFQNKSLSSEQSRIILRLVQRCRAFLIELGMDATALSTLVLHPSHRKPPYKSSNIPREVRYVGDNKLAFRFKFNDVIRDEIKLLKHRVRFAAADQMPMWREDHRIWIVSVNRDNIEPIMAIIKRHRFRFDDSVAEYLTLATNSRGGDSTFAYDEQSNRIIVNVCDNELIANLVRYAMGGDVL